MYLQYITGNNLDYINQTFDNEELYLWGCLDKDSLAGVIATKGIYHICMLFVSKKTLRIL